MIPLVNQNTGINHNLSSFTHTMKSRSKISKTYRPTPFGRITPEIRPRFQHESYWNQLIDTLDTHHDAQHLSTVPADTQFMREYGSMTGKSLNWIRERPFTVDCLATIRWYLDEGWPIPGIALSLNRPENDIRTVTQILNWTGTEHNTWWIYNPHQKIPYRTFITKQEALKWYKNYIPRNQMKRNKILHMNECLPKLQKQKIKTKRTKTVQG